MLANNVKRAPHGPEIFRRFRINEVYFHRYECSLFDNFAIYETKLLHQPSFNNEPPSSKLRGISRLAASLQSKQASGNITRRDL
jgi:hypothetical protein